ncbi:molybdenum ABC transporter ATP-binding protein [Caenimonas aquaedulcis]|uniref:Molybdenum ABC transporter ATP-binding protein n=1 Tax=Caenimonas aquaedulcis TaxID=2793270 RepID=A0A931H366_9BURK|nr:molybdenum ABC transporter ATP-binding protein [Caenimonas aquaedulcis]MBG9387660.1 molybdenum ABC transporter ATP-binding protein [Caenimonas aquaedulcis]
MSAQDMLLRLALARKTFRLDVDCALPAHGITCVFGPSGSGKTSLLRCIAGLERAAGTVRIADAVWQDDAQGVFVPTWKRPLGYVFQEASLFDHLDVRGNLDYGAQRAGAAERRIALAAAIELLGIGDLLARPTHELSGGERQRVAIARALAAQPRVLLLDEPLASIDIARKQDILPWLERLRDELALPMVYVTHSADEVARLADTLVVLERGRVASTGPAARVLARTDDAALWGDDPGALIDGTLALRDGRWHLARVDFPGGSLWLRDDGVAAGQRARLRVLARDVSIATREPEGTSIQNLLPCTVQHIAADAHPSQLLVRLACGETTLLARITARAADSLGLATGMPVWAQVKSVALVQ